LTNSGVVSGVVGTLTLSGATNSSGNINLATGAVLNLAGLTHLTGGAITGAVGVAPVINASGALVFDNASTLLLDNVVLNTSNSTNLGTNVAASPIIMQNGAVINNRGTWLLNGSFTQGLGTVGAFNNNNVSAGSVMIPNGSSGTFIGVTTTGTITNNGLLILNTYAGPTATGLQNIVGNIVNNSIWTINGNTTVTGDVTNSAASTINISGATLSAQSLLNSASGTITMTGISGITTAKGFINNGVLQVGATAGAVAGTATLNGSFVNNSADLVGGVQLAAASGSSLTINSLGSLSGYLGTSSGIFSVPTAQTLTISGGIYTLSNATPIVGDGNLIFSGGAG
jgi:hypothetical protein